MLKPHGNGLGKFEHGLELRRSRGRQLARLDGEDSGLAAERGRLRGSDGGNADDSPDQRQCSEQAWCGVSRFEGATGKPEHGEAYLNRCGARGNGHRIEEQLYPRYVKTIPGKGIVKRSIPMSHHDREKFKLLQRVRKLRGQLDAVEKALGVDEDCGDQLMLLAAVRGGVNGLMGEVLEDHIRFHLVDGAKEQIAPELAEDLIDLVRAYLK